MADEIAVIGGGIVGTSIAAHLSTRTDRPVRVYERRETLASGTTGTSLATWRTTPPATGTDPIHEMKRYSLAYYNDLVAATDRSPWFELVGQLEVATTAEGADALREGTATGGAVPATQADEFLPPAELDRTVYCPALETGEVTGARYRPYLGHFDPDALTAALAERARANGATVRTGVEVTDLHTDGERVAGIVTDGTPTRTAAVITAAGGATPRLLDHVGLDLPVRYTTGYTMRVDPVRPLPTRLPKLDHYETPVGFLGAADRQAIVYRTGPTADVGDYYEAGTPRPDADLPDALPPEVAKQFHAAAARFLPTVAEGRITARDAAPLSRTPDGRPIVDWSPRPGLAVTGLHAAGIQLAPAIGRLVADLVFGEDGPLPHEAVSLARFDGYEPARAPIE